MKDQKNEFGFYVIDDKTFVSRGLAISYLKETYNASNEDAEKYLSQLKREK